MSYTVSDGTVVVKLDGVVVSKVSGNNLDALPDGQHTIRVESTDAANNTGFAEVNITVVTAPPTVTISSPIPGLTNNNKPPLAYTVSDGTVTVKVDGIVVSKASGDTLDMLSEGTHTVSVEAKGASPQTGYGEVTFTVDTQPPSFNITRIKMAGGEAHSSFIAADGSLWAWGANWSGNLGDGSTNEVHIPETIGTDRSWLLLSARSDSNLALKSDGTLWAWGDNSYGQLGDGTTDNKYTPIQIGTDNNWR